MRNPVERELSSHFATLRGLARDLVGDSDADDLLQETVMQALQRPPSEPGPLLGWLRVVVRRLATRHKLAARRRVLREQAVARDEAVPPPQLRVEHGEQLQRLTAAVIALAEPYQRTVLQRYLEELTPTQIAARDGVPLATVKSRLQRGLVMLRERLDEENEVMGEWRGLLASAFGLTESAAVAAGVLAMGIGAKLAFGGVAAAVAVAAWFVIQPMPPAAPAQQLVQQQALAPVVADIGAKTAPTEAAPPERHEVAPPPTTTAFAIIRGRCVDELGNPLAGITALVTGRLREDRATTFQGQIDWHAPPEQVTGADGRFAIQFTPPPPFSFSLGVSGEDRIGGYGRWPEITASQTIDLGDVPVFRTMTARIHVVDTDGLPVGLTDCSLQWTRELDAQSPLEIAVGGGARTDAAGNLKFAHLLAGAYKFQVHGREIVRGDGVELTTQTTDAVHEVAVASILSADVIRGIVVDDAGVPVPRIRVEGAAGDGRLQVSATTAKDGTFQLLRTSNIDRAPVQLWATAKGYDELFPEERFAWGQTEVRLVLHRGFCIEVLAVDAAGAPVEDFSVWVVPNQHAFRVFHHSDSEVRAQGSHPGGLVAIDGLPRGPYFVVVAPSDQRLATSRPMKIEIGEGPLRAVVHLRPAPERLVRIQRRDGTPVATSRIRVTDAAGTKPCVPGNAVPMAAWAFYTINGALREQQPVPILLQELTTDERGEATLRGCDDQPVTVSVQGASHGPAQVDGVRLDLGEPLVVTVAAGATLTGTTQPEVLRALRELAGLPPTGEVPESQERMLPTLNLARGDARYPETFPAPGKVVHFGADGSFKFTNVPPGHWPLVLHTWTNTQEHTEVVADLDLRDDETAALQLDLAALLPAELSGRVFWNDQPLDGSKAANERVQLHIATVDLAGKPFDYWSLLQTDADGRFTWRGRAGTLTLHKTMILTADESVVVTPGAKVARDFHGGSGILRIHAVDADGKPVAGFRMELLNAAAEHCPTMPPTDADGNRQRELALGTYRVEALPKRLLDQQAAAEYLRTHAHGQVDPFAGARIRLGDVTVTAGQTSEVTLRLPAEWFR